MANAFLFPGQGSQYVGMGNALKGFPEAASVFEEADQALGFKLTELIANGPEDELKKTENSQPAILATSVAYARVLLSRGLRPDLLAGHSLGEYSALVIAESLPLSDALRLVKLRGQFMQEAVPQGKGDMIAVMGLEEPDIKSICSEASSYGVVEPACYNYTKQVVLSGDRNAVAVAARLAEQRKATGVIQLAVSAPFHCSLLKSAAEKLAKELDSVDIKKPAIPYVANATGNIVESGTPIKGLLIDQVTKPVLWTLCMEKLVSFGADRFIEMGPGKVLTGHLKRIDRKISCTPIDIPKNLAELL